MAEFANFDEVVAYLDQFLDGFDFTRPGKDQSLGRDLALAMVDQIMDRCERGVDPDGDDWPPNSSKQTPFMPEGYKQWKEDMYEWDDNPNRRTNQMLSQTSLYGRTRIEPKEITLIYGINQKPTSSYSPNNYFDKETDGEVTDLEKAEWAHEMTPEKPARKFYGVGQGDAEKLAEVGQENLDGYIRSSPYGVG